MAHRSSSESSSNLRAYFGQYAGFVYDPTQPATSGFRRLKSFLNGQGVGADQEALRQNFADALGNQFQEKYPGDIGELTAWQRLCRRIGIDPVPEDLKEAQEAVLATHFNIIDLIDDGTDGPLQTFSTKKELRAYSITEKKFFPRQCATASAILTSLLDGGAPTAATASNTDGDTVESLVSAFASVNIGSVPENDPGPPVQHTFIELADEGEEMLPLGAFFSQFPGFSYNPLHSATSEFYRLCRQQKWKRKGDEREEAYRNFANAMASQFGRKYGVHMDDLGAWQRLCQRIEVDPIPDDLEEARETVFNAHVNLVDLVDEGKVWTFDTEMELSAYSKETGKIFPQRRATGILGALLRFIDCPPPPESRRTSMGVLVYD